MNRRFAFVVVIVITALLIGACGGKHEPTPIPTLGNVTVIPLTPTAGQPNIPKYLPTRSSPAAPTHPPATRPVVVTSDSATAIVTIGATPTSPIPRAEVVVNQAVGYNGPGKQFHPVGFLSAGDQVVVEERSPDGRWLHVCCFAGRPGWIALESVRPLTDLSAVPVATALPQQPGTSPLATPTPGP